MTGYGNRSRWLSPEETKKRDKLIMRLHDQGLTARQIGAQVRLNKDWVYIIIRRELAKNVR